jgi:hypothetical protein
MKNCCSENSNDESEVIISGDIDDLIFCDEEWHESER